ncbi:MAG: ribonuclease P protein component [Rhodospirillales bacterium]|nr:ribonuclease P protein component [Rhodospirillales bacterium]MDE2458141.1 ribonuclease P protein component [Rhodospirillales bacterium]
MAKAQTPPARLTRRAEFLRLAARGQKIAKHGFVLQAAKGGVADVLRVGYTATKKIGNAVTRNRAKRRLREAARLVLAGQAMPGVELVLIARRETGDIEFSRLKQNFAKALDEALA